MTNKKLYSKLLIGLAIFTMMWSCTDQTDPPEEAPTYRWDTPAKLPAFKPIYESGIYYIFEFDLESREVWMMKLEENTGDTLLHTQLVSSFTSAPNSLTSQAILTGDEIEITFDNKYLRVDKNTGAVTHLYEFRNYLWWANIEEDYVYACSFGPTGVDSFYYSYCHKDIGEQVVFYRDHIEGNDKYINGSAPREAKDGSIIFTLSKGIQEDFTNQLIKVMRDTTIKLTLPFTQETVGRVFDDDDNIYLLDKAGGAVLAYRKDDLTLLWSAPTVPYAGGHYILTEDRIYMIPSRSIDNGRGEVIYIIDKEDGAINALPTTVSNTSNIERVGNNLYFQKGGCYTFNMDTEKLTPPKPEERSNRGSYFSFLGISPNSKIMYDEDGWHCFPL